MKKNFLKSTIVVVAVAASSLGAWRAYNAYEVTDNTLLAENIEALSEAGPVDFVLEWFDKTFDPCFKTGADLQPVQCKESETNTTSSNSTGGNVTVPVNGVPISVGISTGSSSSSNNTVYNQKEKLVCQSARITLHCDRREQTDCNGNKLGSAACK